MTSRVLPSTPRARAALVALGAAFASTGAHAEPGLVQDVSTALREGARFVAPPASAVIDPESEGVIVLRGAQVTTERPRIRRGLDNIHRGADASFEARTRRFEQFEITEPGTSEPEHKLDSDDQYQTRYRLERQAAVQQRKQHRLERKPKRVPYLWHAERPRRADPFPYQHGIEDFEAKTRIPRSLYWRSYSPRKSFRR